MEGWLTPGRRRGVELLDLASTPDHVRRSAMADLARSNTLFGGTRAVLTAVQAVLPDLPETVVVLDVGTGTGDIADAANEMLTSRGRGVAMLGLDRSITLTESARTARTTVVVGDALALPVRAGSADLVVCSQLLHHFFDDEARRVVAELDRVCRGWVVVADLQRGWLPLVGFWLASIALRFHDVTRRDGVTSVRRGFTSAELESLVREVTGTRPRMRRGVFWRLSATWRASGGRLQGS